MSKEKIKKIINADFVIVLFAIEAFCAGLILAYFAGAIGIFDFGVGSEDALIAAGISALGVVIYGFHRMISALFR